jgi:hypothetical protein
MRALVQRVSLAREHPGATWSVQYTFLHVNYLLARGGQQTGPHSLDELERLVREGSAAGTDLVWKPGMATWAQLSTILTSPAAEAAKAAQPAAPHPGLIPPSLHWGAVLAFGCLTLGMFCWFWSIVQANFVRKLDPANRFLVTFEIMSGLMIPHMLAFIVAAFSVTSADYVGGKLRSDSALVILIILAFFLYPLYLTIYWIGIFKMRRSIENYYSTAEPIGLHLSNEMTFYGGIFYFQNHFTRIANWKRTGVLEPAEGP